MKFDVSALTPREMAREFASATESFYLERVGRNVLADCEVIQ